MIGGSIGIAARKKKLAREVVGIGRRKSSIRKAIGAGAIDKGGLSLKRGVEDADLVIIATPVNKVTAKIKEVAACLEKGAIIIDVNSTKEEVVRYADSIMPEGLYFVGTHPIAGLEKSGVLSASPGLFKDTICILTPTKCTKREALNKIKRFWRRLGAEIRIFSPQDHDKAVAKISHLPHLLSFCLCDSLSSKDIKVAGTGFKDTTRIAKSDPRMWSDIFMQNSPNLLRSIENFERSLKKLKADIKGRRGEDLLKRLKQARKKRESLG